MYYIYFLLSLRNKKSYVGKTGKPPNERLTEHNSGSNVWTGQNGPFKLIYFEEYVCKEDADKRELFYKTGIGRKIKKAIIDCLIDNNI